MKTVLQKYIADSGYCSRRKAEELIRRSVSGKPQKDKTAVLVNGQAPELGTRVGPEDEVTVYGKKIGLAKDHIYIILNKPVGYVCTNRAFKSERNIFELVNIKERLFTVGRLDKNSRGLVLLTNDGELTERLSHPRFEHEKEYLIWCKKFNDEFQMSDEAIFNVIKKLKKGIRSEDELLKVKEAMHFKNGEFKIILTEGKKRQLRRMFRALGIRVNDLQRTRIGNLKLGNLKEGEWRKLEGEEIVGLLKNKL